MRAGMRYVADRYSRGKNTLGGADFVDSIFKLGQGDLEPAREFARLRIGRQSARHSLIKAPANQPLEVARRSMQSRLGYVELSRRRFERTAFRDRGECADMRVGYLVFHRFR